MKQLFSTLGATALLVAGGIANLEPAHAADFTGRFSYNGFFIPNTAQNTYTFFNAGGTKNSDGTANIDIGGNQGTLGTEVGSSGGKIYDVSTSLPTTPFITFTNTSGDTLDLTAIGPASTIQVPISFLASSATPTVTTSSSVTSSQVYPTWFLPSVASQALDPRIALPNNSLSSITFTVIPTQGVFKHGTDITPVIGGITTPSDVLGVVNPSVPLSFAGIFISQVPEPSNTPGTIALGVLGLVFFARSRKQFA